VRLNCHGCGVKVKIERCHLLLLTVHKNSKNSKRVYKTSKRSVGVSKTSIPMHREFQYLTTMQMQSKSMHVSKITSLVVQMSHLLVLPCRGRLANRSPIIEVSMRSATEEIEEERGVVKLTCLYTSVPHHLNSLIQPG
jgi:hypothetical protein